MNPDTHHGSPQENQQPDLDANNKFDNADFIAGRVSRKDRRKMEAAQSEAPHSLPHDSDAAPPVAPKSESEVFLGPTDDRETTDIPTFDSVENPQGVVPPYGVYTTQATEFDHDANTTQISDAAKAESMQHLPVEGANTAWIPIEEGVTASTVSGGAAADSTEFVDPSFVNAGPDSLITTAEQPPVQIPPQSYPAGPQMPGDDVDMDDDEEKRSPLVLIISILLVAVLLVITAIAVWAYTTKEEPATVPSPSVLEPSEEEESSEPSLMPDTQTPSAEPTQSEEATPSAQPTQVPTPEPQQVPTQQPEPPQPAPQPSAAPQPAPTVDPQPPAASATPDPAPSNP